MIIIDCIWACIVEVLYDLWTEEGEEKKGMTLCIYSISC